MKNAILSESDQDVEASIDMYRKKTAGPRRTLATDQWFFTLSCQPVGKAMLQHFSMHCCLHQTRNVCFYGTGFETMRLVKQGLSPVVDAIGATAHVYPVKPR